MRITSQVAEARVPEIPQSTLRGGQTLYVTGTDAAGFNTYEIRGKLGARYISVRGRQTVDGCIPASPNVVCFIQTRSTRHLSQYDTEQKGSRVDFGRTPTGGLLTDFTDIDGPLVPLHVAGFRREQDVPGYVAGDFDF